VGTAWDVTGDEIQTWAQRFDAAGKLPDLVRRLLLATTPLGTIDMRADGGVWLSGWDGIVEAHRGTTFCPYGASVWELTTRKATRKKLDDDFDKRKKKAPAGIVLQDVAYVVVTAQRFEEKAAWVAKRAKEGVFKAVQVHDADDLAAWLTQAPAVARWFGAMIGKPTSDLFDLEGFAAEWRARTSPALPFELLLAGRERERAAELVRAWPSQRPSPLFVRADTKDEAVSFVAAALSLSPGPEREQFRARTLIVESRDALRWAQRGGVGEPALILPHYDDFEPKDAVRNSFVVVPLDGRTTPGHNEIRLAPVPYLRVAEILVGTGIPEAEARNRAEESGGNLASLQRLYGYSAPPVWVGRFDRTLLSVLLLVGAWQPDNEADREVIRALGADPGEVRKLCEELSLVPDAATVKDVEHWGPTTWTFRAPGDVWQALVGGIPGELLQRFQSVAFEVLGEADPRFELPPNERVAAAMRGKVLKESTALRDGLARSLARLAQSDQQLDALHGPGAGSRVAQVVVRRLLEPAWIRWASASDVLPLLAEAAPAVFLDRLKESLDKGDDGAEHLLAEEGPFGSPHTGLLWALETLGWSPQYLLRVARVLARLTESDKGRDRPGRLANRPERSLRQMLRYALAETLAPVEARTGAWLDIVSAYPNAAYPVLLHALSARREIDMLVPHSRPHFLLEVPDDETRQVQAEKEAPEAILAMTGTAIAYAAEDADRWARLVYATCSSDDRDEASRRVLEHLERHRDHILDDNANLWSALGRRINLTAPQGRTQENYRRLRELYAHFTPPDAVLRSARLFRRGEDLPEVPREMQWQDRERVLKDLRNQALVEFQKGEVLEIIRRLIALGADCTILGGSLGGAQFAGDLDDHLLGSNVDPTLAPLVVPYFGARWAARGDRDDWAKATLLRLISEDRRAEAISIAKGLPMGAALWDFIDSLGEPIRTEYWRSISLVQDPGASEPAYWKRAVETLIEVGNVAVAAETIAYGEDRLPAEMALWVAQVFVNNADAAEKFFKANISHDYMLQKLIERAGSVASAPTDVLALLELMYSHTTDRPVLPLTHLSAAHAQHPEIFVDSIRAMYDREDGSDNTGERDPEQRRTRAAAAYRVLESWHGYPGEGEGADQREQILHKWCLRVLELVANEGRSTVGAIEVAKVLSRAPAAADGRWPCLAARRLLQAGASPHLRSGLHTAKRNLRGATRRSLGEGGKQERVLAAQFRESADALRAEWPETATLLDGLTSFYEREAAQMDSEAATTLRRAGAEPEDFQHPKSPPPPSPRKAVVAEGLVQITSIAIQDLCAIGSLKLDLSPPTEAQGQWMVLLGENGTGKTSILRAIALAVGGPNIAQDALGKVPAGLVRQDKPESTAIVECSEVTYSMTVGALPREHVERYGPNNGTPRPLLFGYGCRRGSALGGQEPTQVDAQSSDVATLFDEKERVLPTRGWLKDLWALASDRAHDPDRVHDNVYHQVLAKLCQLLPDEKTRLEVDAAEVWVTGADVGGRVPLAALSDGYLTTLGWAADLVQRWLSWARRRGVTPAGDFFAEQMEGLVLLDEVDLHLHPQWQRDIIRKIRKVFPRMSFVVTTHNPLTLLGAQAAEVWILRQHEGRILAEQGRESPALMTSSQIYAAYFGITSLHGELGEKLRRYGFLAGTPARTEAEEREVHVLLAELRGKGVDPGWTPVPREEPPPFREDEEDEGP
jgi:AAA domain, putative AbiEii toxin, Type IV TA system